MKEAERQPYNEPGTLPDPRGAPQPGTVDEPFRERTGNIIGPYKLLEPLGEGGFGTVFLAAQEQPVQRRVALKLLKPGMDSDQVLARFEAERQALAMMDHPNIAKVLDAGTTPAGRPYFVMELVKGIPITKFCDQEHLTPRERLALFVPVCQAVQHAHQKGIIHRDLKPSNVLIALYDGQPVPKVIDFGVAKATAQKLTERTLHTGVGQIVGTLEYMAPEQAELNNLDIDTRADIYSLGVILYELLTGAPPFPVKQLRSAGFTEMLRILREVEPAKPSTKLSHSDALPSIAAKRKLEPRKLTRLLSGDLDWVVMRCLEKERSRRYETANQLAQEIERYLNDEPVMAGPPSARYRLGKFVRRNRGAVLATVVVVAALLVGTVMASWQALVATRARQEALTAKMTAEAKEAETQAVLDFVQSKVFAATRPQSEGGVGMNATLRQAIEATLPAVDQDFTERPLLEARLRMMLGISYWYLGWPQTAVDQFQRARLLYTQHLGPDHADTLLSMENLALSYCDFGTLLDVRSRDELGPHMKGKVGPRHPLGSMGGGWPGNRPDARGQYLDACKLLEETLIRRQALLGPDHADALRSRHNLATCYFVLGRYADALKLFEQNLTLQTSQLGGQNPDTLQSMWGAAGSLFHLHREAEAVSIIDECIQRASGVIVDPDLLSGVVYFRLRHFEQARDAAGCRSTAELWENLRGTGPSDLYNAACYRAVTAAVLKKATSPDGNMPQLAVEEASRAMAWLQQAVSAGYRSAAHMKQDKDLDALRDRPDFKKLLATLEAANNAAKP
jgi:non-specific serine/threonine protein kinase/serine/threonine-protein kinase